MTDPVNHPAHYTSHPSGVEVIDLTEQLGFSVGNALKYLLRHPLKGRPREDLEKARWYVDRELRRRHRLGATASRMVEAEPDAEVGRALWLLWQAEHGVSQLLAARRLLSQLLERHTTDGE